MANKNVTKVNETPSYIQEAGSMGNESINSEDLAVPRISLLQSISPEVNADDTNYVEGATPGKMLNTLTHDLYDTLRVVNLYYKKDYVVFKKRTLGGGFLFASSSKDAAKEFVDNSDTPENLDTVETGNHYCLLLNDDSQDVVTHIVIPTKITQLRFSRKWNTLIMQAGGPRFAGIWTVNSILEKNNKGQSYYNYAIFNNKHEWCEEGLFETAKKQFEAISSQMK